MIFSKSAASFALSTLVFAIVAEAVLFTESRSRRKIGNLVFGGATQVPGMLKYTRTLWWVETMARKIYVVADIDGWRVRSVGSLCCGRGGRQLRKSSMGCARDVDPARWN